MRKNWYKNKNSKVESAFFGEMKKTISTTLPISVYEFAKINNIQFSYVLTNAIKELMGEEIPTTKQELKEKLLRMSQRYERLTRYMVKVLGEDGANKILNEAESVGRILEKLEKEKQNL